MFAKRFDAAGDAMGNDFVVNTYTTGNQFGFFGQVAHDARGNFVVTWFGDSDGNDAGSFGQRFSASGARRGAEFRVNTYITSAQILPSIAGDAVGNFAVVWESLDQDGSDWGSLRTALRGTGAGRARRRQRRATWSWNRGRLSTCGRAGGT